MRRADSRSITLEELVARRRIFLRAGLQHLDRGDDRCQRRAKLVGGVRRELALRRARPARVAVSSATTRMAASAPPREGCRKR